MSKKLILFLMVLLFGSTSFLRADELTVHDGTATNSYVPVYGFYADAYLKCEMVFPASELTDMADGTINGITFYATTPASDLWGSNFQVFVKEVESASISDFAGPEGAVIVYEGTLDGTASEMTITFNTPYGYAGGNLLIGVYNTTKGSYKSITWGGETVDGSSVQGYSYSSLESISASQRGFLPKTTFEYTPGSGPVPPTPPTPTGDLTITPNPFELAYRPVNGWMEPYSVKIINGGSTATIEGTLSNTSGDAPFALSEPVEATLETGDIFTFDIEFNSEVNGDYTEEFTLFYVLNSKDIITIPVTGNIYTAEAGDIVETAKNVAWSGDAYTDTPDAATIHPNYNLYGMTQMKPDAIYKFTLGKDSRLTATGGDDFIAVYNYGANTHLTAAVEPVIIGTSGIIDDEVLLKGTYYLVVASNNISDININRVELPAPSELVALAPADGATGLEGTIELTWEGGENATQYQVLFGTSPTSLPVVLDWTAVDENYGTFNVTSLVENNTQYFWQIKAKNSEGMVQTVRRGFTTALTAPNTVTASEQQIFTDGSTLIKWKHSAGGGGVLPETQIGSGTSNSNYLPTYNLYNYSLTEQIYTGDEIGGAGVINSISFYSLGTITRNLKVYMANTDKTSFTGGSDWVAMTADDLVFEGDVAMTPNTWVTIELTEPFNFDGSNMLLTVTDHTGTWTSSIYYYTFDATAQAINVYQDSAPYSALAPSGSGTVRNFKNQIIINKEGAKAAEMNRGFLGFNLYYGDVKVNDELLQEKQYLLENLPYNMDGHDINVTAVYDEGESGHSTPEVLVQVSGYATLTGHVNELISGDPVEGVTVTFYGKDEFNNDVTFDGTTNASGKYTITVKAGNYYRGIATQDGMEPSYMADPVAVAYEGTETVDFIIHEEYKPVLSVYAEEIDPSMSKVTWSINTAISGGGVVVGGGDEFSVNFDDNQIPAGWVNIDGDGDGNVWVSSANPGIYHNSGVSLSGTGHNASEAYVISGSYANQTGVALTPNNYLVTPQVTIGAGSTFSFWACAQDASYAAEHFGVAVSTAGNTSASDFTMLQEWTLTAKGSGEKSIGRDGQTRAQGNWYLYSVDLDAYAGQNVYLAIRHFNCTDMFILNVDDVELAAASKGRSVQNYTLYRKAILKENGLVPADSVMLADGYTDTLYADFTWNNMEPGLYQYGVSAVYPSPSKGGNRDQVVIGDGTSTTYVTPFNSLWGYSFVEQIFTADEIGMAGTINSIAFNMQSTSPATHDIEIFMVNTDRAEFATTDDYVTVTAGDKVFEGSVTFEAGAWTTITLDTPFQYDGANNLMIGMHEYTSGYSTRYFYYTSKTGSVVTYHSDSANPDPYNLGSYSGNKYVSPNRANITIDIVPGGGGGGGNDNPVTPITWSNILPKDMETTVTVNAHVAAGTAAGAIVTMTNDFENIAYDAVLDETGSVTFENFRKGDYVVTVDLEGYTSTYAETPVSIWGETEITAELTEILKPVDEVNVSITGFARWTEVIPVDRMPERYFVTLDGVLVAETTENYYQFVDLVEGSSYTAGVAVVYSTGMSAYVTKNFTYEGCAGVATQVEGLAVDTANCVDMNVVLVWNGGTPTPTPPTPPTPPTGNTFNFDDGTMMGWSSIDVDGDGNGWVSSANPGIYHNSGVNLSGTGHNASEAYVISGSYANQTGQALTPNNYLVSPTKAEYTGISFWACAQDANYAAEHFGVAVATGNSASDFVMVQEWTMTAKGEGAMSEGRGGQTRAQGAWHEYIVDLSAYAGQEIWVAIRHFNCTDMFILNVDDITLGVPEKATMDNTPYASATTAPAREMWDVLKTFNAAEGGHYGVVTDGEYIYTSNWGYSSAAHNFYKYDMDGNMIEGFEISGCGTLRGMTFDGEYIYGVANSSTIYCVDLNNHALISQTNSAYGAMRCISYDPVRDGFWVVGNWSGNLTLVDRTGAIQFTGPAPTSASDVAYFKDADGVEHVYCFNNGDNGVYDYNITTNTMGGQVFNFSSVSGVSGDASSGGCHIANYGDKLAFYGDMQQSPNYIVICELGEAGGGGQPAGTLTPNKFNILVDGEVVGVTASSYYTYECPDYENHVYTVVWVDGNYGVSCEATVEYEIHHLNVNENELVNAIYPNPTSGDLHINAQAMTRISIVNTMGQVVYEQNVNADEVVLDMAKYEAGVYMVNIYTENGSSVKRVTVVK